MARNVTQLFILSVLALSRSATAAQFPISLINGDFELDAAVVSPPTGWTLNSGGMYVTAGSGLSPLDPTAAYSGTRFLSANRLAPDPDVHFPNTQAMSIFQTVDVSSFSSMIDLGSSFARLSFAYSDNDPGDNGVVSMRFLNSGGAALASDILFSTSSSPTGIGAWATSSLLGALPSGTRTIRFGLTGEYAGSGTARNVSYDAVSAVLLDEAPARDRVAGNLVMFNDNGRLELVSRRTGNR
jgi:hypothetical protein